MPNDSPSNESRLVVVLPEEMHRKYKAYVYAKGETMGNDITEYIKKTLSADHKLTPKQ